MIAQFLRATSQLQIARRSQHFKVYQGTTGWNQRWGQLEKELGRRPTSAEIVEIIDYSMAQLYQGLGIPSRIRRPSRQPDLGLGPTYEREPPLSKAEIEWGKAEAARMKRDQEGG